MSAQGRGPAQTGSMEEAAWRGHLSEGGPAGPQGSRTSAFRWGICLNLSGHQSPWPLLEMQTPSLHPRR